MKEKQESKVLQKLRSSAGETIAETLISLLISALAMVMLAGAISATANMITSSDRKMGQYYENDANLATQTTKKGDLSVEIVSEGITIETQTTSYFLNDAFPSKPVVSYKKSTT